MLRQFLHKLTATRNDIIKHVHLIDTSIASDNIGDEIINEEIRHVFSALFNDCYVSTSSGHDGLGVFGRQLAQDADIVFLLGTNALSPRDQFKRRFIWSVAEDDIAALENKVVLFGVGANREFETVDAEQRDFLRKVLSKKWKHSVRDGLGLKILENCGLKGINTTCPTLWRYAQTPPMSPRGKAPSVCFTLTKHKAAADDQVFVKTLLSLYEDVLFWPQQPRDLAYLKEIAPGENIQIVPPNLPAYDKILANTNVDVVGTRLHGGIRGLLHNRRALVIAIDNRATEIGLETGLPTLPRALVGSQLVDRLTSEWETSLSIPEASIQEFLGQFSA